MRTLKLSLKILASSSLSGSAPEVRWFRFWPITCYGRATSPRWHALPTPFTPVVCVPCFGLHSFCQPWSGHRRFDDRDGPALSETNEKTTTKERSIDNEVHPELVVTHHRRDAVALCHSILHVWFSGVFRAGQRMAMEGGLRGTGLRRPGRGGRSVASDRGASTGSLGVVWIHDALCPRDNGVLPLLPGQVGYGVLGCCCLTGGVALLGRGGKRKRPDNGSGLTHGDT